MTLDPSCPEAERVAVNDGRILHVSGAAAVTEVLGGREVVHDDRFSDDGASRGAT